jgi:hypothetical protein
MEPIELVEMKKENCFPDVHVLYHSPRWHIYWNLFKHGYRKWAVNFKRYTSIGYHLAKVICRLHSAQHRMQADKED